MIKRMGMLLICAMLPAQAGWFEGLMDAYSKSDVSSSLKNSWVQGTVVGAISFALAFKLAAKPAKYYAQKSRERAENSQRKVHLDSNECIFKWDVDNKKKYLQIEYNALINQLKQEKS